MKALTLWRPWPHAIFYGGKPIENRPWKPWPGVIGSNILIHAGIKYDSDGAQWMRDRGLYDPPDDKWCPRGCIVGMVKVVGYVHISDEICDQVTEDALKNPWFFGPYGWILENPVAFQKPVPRTGALGLWNVDGETLNQVRVVAGQLID